MFFDTKLSISLEHYYLKPRLQNSTTVIVKTMNTFNKERRIHTETSIAVKLSQKTQNFDIQPANEGSGHAFYSTDLCFISGSNVGNNCRVFSRKRGPRKPVFTQNLDSLLYLKIQADLIEYNIVGDTEVPLLHSFSNNSRLKYRDITTTGQYMNYQTFCRPKLGALLENSFHRLHIDLRDTTVKEYFLHLWLILKLF